MTDAVADSRTNTTATSCARVTVADRRTNSWRTIVGSVIYRRRSAPRRTDDSGSPHYVDIHEPHLFYVAVGALLLCVADAFFTMTLLSFYGSYELNPVMDYFIQNDIQHFFFVKFGMTALGIMFLVIHKNFRILNIISGYQILYASLAVYLLLVLYELFMLVVIPVASILF
ncbi:MAG: DUF5658 family protein [Gammaproteobacteria bacterium]|jgi:hypothetical protein